VTPHPPAPSTHPRRRPHPRAWLDGRRPPSTRTASRWTHLCCTCCAGASGRRRVGGGQAACCSDRACWSTQRCARFGLAAVCCGSGMLCERFIVGKYGCVVPCLHVACCICDAPPATSNQTNTHTLKHTHAKTHTTMRTGVARGSPHHPPRVAGRRRRPLRPFSPPAAGRGPRPRADEALGRTRCLRRQGAHAASCHAHGVRLSIRHARIQHARRCHDGRLPPATPGAC